jgi:hypothetical protein
VGPRKWCALANGTEAWVIPGLAAHLSKPSCRPRLPSSAEVAAMFHRSRKV